jgi:hypothetical protein
MSQHPSSADASDSIHIAVRRRKIGASVFVTPATGDPKESRGMRNTVAPGGGSCLLQTEQV